MLVFDRVPFEHTTGQDTIAVLVVSDNFVNTSNTANKISVCFSNFLENCEIKVVEETNWNIDWIPSETLNHLYN